MSEAKWSNERIAELERMYKELAELNQRNCDDAARINGANDALMAMAQIGIAELKKRDDCVAKLTQQIATAHASLQAMREERDDLAARVNDGEAVQMLRWIVDAYHPQWYYEMGKTGYECAFCKRMFKTSKEFQEIADHKLGCQWSQTKAWLDSQPVPTQEQS